MFIYVRLLIEHSEANLKKWGFPQYLIGVDKFMNVPEAVTRMVCSSIFRPPALSNQITGQSSINPASDFLENV